MERESYVCRACLAARESNGTTAAQKVAAFENELREIKNDDLRSFVARCLEAAPDYFFEMPASTTGRHHPNYALGQGGLVRHVKAAVRVAVDLMALECGAAVFSDDEKDEIVAALILHDCVKKENPSDKYASARHPIFAARLILKTQEETGFDYWRACRIADMVERHMGQWTTDWRGGGVILKEPATAAERFVHTCDFIASRKYIEISAG